MVKISKSLSYEERKIYIKVLREFIIFFTWSYEDMKIYDTNIIQHNIPLNPNTKPFRWKLRRINPILLLFIEKEVKKLIDAKIIIPLRYSTWVENCSLYVKKMVR